MKQRFYVLCFLISGFFLIRPAESAVTVSLPTISATKGDTIEVVLSVSDLSGQNVFDFNGVVSFREDVIDFLGASSSSCITTLAGWGPPTVNTTEDGQALFANFGANALSGAGDLLKMQFHIHGDYGDSTALEFAAFEFTRTSQITPVFENGKIRINLKPIRVVVTTNKGGQLEVIVDGQRQTVPFSTTWYPGTVHAISIDEMQNGSPGTRFYFESWSDGGSRSHNVAPTTDVTFMANLQAEYYLDIQSEYGTPEGAGWYPENTPVEIKVDSVYLFSTTKRARFNTWNGSGTASYSGNENPTIITLSGPTTQTAVWNLQYWLAVKTLPENVTTISGTGWYNENESVTTGQAQAMVGNRTFKGWRVDGNLVTGNPVSVVMNQAHEAVADYSFDITVTVTTSTGQGVVIIDGQIVAAPVQRVWSAGSQHSIGVPETQAEDNGIRSRFMAWSDGGEITHTVAPQTNTTYTALLTDEYYLDIQVQPNNLGQISGSGWYEPNSMVTVGPAPETFSQSGSIYSFYAWRQNAAFNDNYTFNLILDQPKTATAIYYKNYYIAGEIKCGTIPAANVKVRLTGGKQDSVFTNESGSYVFEGVLPEKYAVTPISDEFRFEPEAWNYSLLFSNKKMQNFNAIDVGAPTVTVLQPNGGERYAASATDSIKWTATDNVGIDSIRCYYSRDEGQTWTFLIQLGAQFRTCPWFMPEKNGTRYRVKVEAIDKAGNSAADVSDANFEIYGGVRVVEKAESPLVNFELKQNFPNPFNPVTDITYHLPRAAVVQLKIYNVNGQLIQQLLAGKQPAGAQVVRWNGQNDQGQPMPSGIYYYQLQAGGYVATRKMLLMR